MPKQISEPKKSFEERMEEILSGKRKPDLIVCSPAGWAMVEKHWKQRQNMPETNPTTHYGCKVKRSDF